LSTASVQGRASPIVRSFERHRRARGSALEAATRADLEAFMADLLGRRAPSTVATYHKVLKLLYAWLVEEEIPADPMARLRPPIVPDKPVPIVPADALKRLFVVSAGSTFAR
jgi:integrase/recombinase XerC